VMNIGDKVFVNDDGIIQPGILLEWTSSEEAKIRFKKPNKPDVCSDCGSPTLSTNLFSGEVSCMRSGCGHKHGFEEYNETVLISQFIDPSKIRNISR